MSQTQDLPSLFGRFTTILQDHEHLVKTMRALRSMCSSLEADQAATTPAIDPHALITQLRADLAEHFSAEESPGYFGIVMSEAPSLVTQVAGLKWEHLAMLRAADALCEMTKDRARWRDVPEPARQLMAQLEQHERAESTLLRGLFRPSQ